MRCPYCASEVPQEATVCARCSRDLYLVKRLQERIDCLEKELADRGRTAAAGDEKPLAAPPDSATAAPAPHAAADSSSRSYWESLLLALGAALVLLLVAHAVLLFAYDVKPLYFRIVSVMIPIPFGFALLVWHPRRMGISIIAGFIMALASVSLMLITTSRIDDVPVLPQDAREVREVLEYVVSIGLAFLTGLLLGRLRYHRLSFTPQPGRMTVFLAQLFSSEKQGELRIKKLANRIQELVSTLTPIFTAAASVYAGVKALLGDGG